MEWPGSEWKAHKFIPIELSGPIQPDLTQQHCVKYTTTPIQDQITSLEKINCGRKEKMLFPPFSFFLAGWMILVGGSLAKRLDKSTLKVLKRIISYLFSLVNSSDGRFWQFPTHTCLDLAFIGEKPLTQHDETLLCNEFVC